MPVARNKARGYFVRRTYRQEFKRDKRPYDNERALEALRAKRLVKPIRVIKRLEMIAVLRKLIERRRRNFAARRNQKLLVGDHCLIAKPDLALLGIHKRNLRTRMKINPAALIIIFFA